MAKRIPRLEVIEAFIEAAGAPSFRIAAERCALSPAAFSRRIQAFAAFVGHDVFERHARGVRLTEAGRACLAAVEPPYRNMRRAALEISSGAFARKVTISLSHSLSVGWLIPRLDRFHACHPNIEVSIQTLRTAEGVRSGDVDLGVCASDVDTTGLHVEHLLDIHITPVACPRIAVEFQSGRGRLERHRLLALQQPPDLWAWWASEAGVDDSRLQIGPRFDVVHAAYEAAASGLGVAAGMHATVGLHLASGRLVDLGLPSARYPGAYRLAARSSRLRNPAVLALWSWMIGEGRDTLPADRPPPAYRDPSIARMTSSAIR